ncbi:MAG: hypothetical protein Tsb002_08960 [Wenzhouxiangellaceae bacterium]
MRWIILALGLLFSHLANSYEELLGTWEGELNISPDASVVVQFIFETNDAGDLSGVLNAPDEPNLRDIPFSQVEYQDGNLNVDIEEVSGTYTGSLQDGSISGSWSQMGSSFNLDLKPYQKPVLADEIVDKLLGKWVGKLQLPDGERELTIVTRFEPDPENKIVAFIDSPDQAVFNLVVEQLQVEDDQIEMKVMRPEIVFTGSIKDGSISGIYKQKDVMPLELRRGEYVNPELTLPEPLQQQILGTWQGKLAGSLFVGFRFLVDDKGRFVGYFDSIDQGRFGIPITDINIDGSAINLEVEGILADFSGELSEEVIKGDFELRGQVNALRMEKGPYLTHNLQLPEGVAQKLVGEWQGKVANTNLFFRFERDGEKLNGYLDVPGMSLNGIPITEINMNDSEITMIIRGISAEFNGSLGSGEINGEWTMPEIQLPLVVKNSASDSSGS